MPVPDYTPISYALLRASWSLVTGSLVMPDTLAAWLLLADRASTTRTRCQAIFFMSIVEIAETRSGAARRGATKRTVLIVMATYRCHRKIDSSSDERIILTHIDEEGQLHLNAHLCERIRGRRVAREICMLIYSARSAPCIYMRARLCSRFFRVPTIFFLFFAISLSVIRFPPENLTATSDAAQCAFLARTEIGRRVVIQKWFDERVGGALIPRRTMYWASETLRSH